MRRRGTCPGQPVIECRSPAALARPAALVRPRSRSARPDGLASSTIRRALPSRAGGIGRTPDRQVASTSSSPMRCFRLGLDGLEVADGYDPLMFARVELVPGPGGVAPSGSEPVMGPPEPGALAAGPGLVVVPPRACVTSARLSPSARVIRPGRQRSSARSSTTATTSGASSSPSVASCGPRRDRGATARPAARAARSARLYGAAGLRRSQVAASGELADCHPRSSPRRRTRALRRARRRRSYDDAVVL